MGGMTVAALGALAQGEKAAFGRSIFGRRNKDNSISITLRRKVAGKSVDVPVVRIDEISKATISAALREAERVREKAPAQRAVIAVPKVAGTTTKRSLAAAWDDFLSKVTWSEVNRAGNVLRVEKYLKPWALWEKPVTTITARDVAELLGPIRAATPSQYRKLVGLLNQSFTQAVGLQWIEATPMLLAQKLLANTSGKVAKAKHHPALMDWTELRELVKQIRNATGEPSVRNALFLQCLSAQRTGEVLGAQWSEFHDLNGALPRWVIPRSRMKVDDPRRGDHVLHLSKQCAEWLRSLPKAESGYLFPGRSGHDTIASEAMSKHMRLTLGMRDRMVPHSWRSSLRTLSSRAVGKNGQPLFNSEWTESVLDHLSGDAITDAYQRGQHAAEGGRILAWWADMLLAEG